MAKNAKDKGRDEGFVCFLSYLRISQESFKKIGVVTSQKVYKKPEKQAEFMQGWMENWQEPHPANCTCDICRDINALIDIKGSIDGAIRATWRLPGMSLHTKLSLDPSTPCRWLGVLLL